ncbi:MAG: hypothetical protein SWY16_01325 [Cyanobacteriota bacterium]|nr:hypothetical protein [Cyanobacteriota bacterium]
MTAFRTLKVTVVAGLICILWSIATPVAIALVPIELSDISYRECPPEFSDGAVVSGSTSAANCFLVTGKAENRTRKPVVNADVFGRIYDANNNNVLPNRGRIGSIDEVPPGTSDFQFRISVPATQPLPLQLKKLKASGFVGRVRR